MLIINVDSCWRKNKQFWYGENKAKMGQILCMINSLSTSYEDVTSKEYDKKKSDLKKQLGYQ